MELKPGWVIVEGGEPLLRTDIFPLLALMRERHLEVHLITNGLELSGEKISFLKEKEIKVMISMDGASKATYESIRNGSSFFRVLKVAEKAAKEGILKSLNLTLLKTNFREIPEVFELAVSLGVPSVTILGLKPCLSYEEKLLSPEEYEEAIALACRAGKKTGIGFFFDEPFFYPVLQERQLPATSAPERSGIILDSTSACIFGEYLFIDSDGAVKPCSFSPVSSGHLKERSLLQIWEEMQRSPFLQELRVSNYRSGHCQGCSYLLRCKGCRSRTFSLRGDWLASDPACPLGEKGRELRGGEGIG